jgi:hypothetical protein
MAQQHNQTKEHTEGMNYGDISAPVYEQQQHNITTEQPCSTTAWHNNKRSGNVISTVELTTTAQQHSGLTSTIQGHS